MSTAADVPAPVVPLPLGRREANRRAREQAYLHAAMDIVSRDGLRSLTMLRLADEVDAAVGTVYTYFPSKGALIGELQREAIECRQSRSPGLIDRAPDGEQRFGEPIVGGRLLLRGKVFFDPRHRVEHHAGVGVAVAPGIFAEIPAAPRRLHERFADRLIGPGARAEEVLVGRQLDEVAAAVAPAGLLQAHPGLVGLDAVEAGAEGRTGGVGGVGHGSRLKTERSVGQLIRTAD